MQVDIFKIKLKVKRPAAPVFLTTTEDLYLHFLFEHREIFNFNFMFIFNIVL